MTVDDVAALNRQLTHAADRLDRIGDADLKALVGEIVGLVTDLHGAAVTRVLEIIDEAAPGDAPAVFSRLLDDELVSSVFELHDLRPPEPVPVQIRRSR